MKKRQTSERAIWKGFLRFSLIGIPVGLYSAKRKDHGKIDLDWLHAECHHRIQYQKVCPVHGEVAKDDIVSGYKTGTDQYVIIEPKELQKLHRRSDKVIAVESFIAPDALDPMYCTENSYYLLPEGPAADLSYAVMREAMNRKERHAIARVILFRREHMVVIRPLENLLLLTTLSYADQYQDATSFEKRVGKARAAAEEVELAETLVDSLTEDKFDFSAYQDPYTEQLMRLIEAKKKGKEVSVPQEKEEPVALDFMAALKKSLVLADKKAGRATHKKRHARAS